MDQPSTNTNKSNLNGRAINIGDNIIIPSDIRTDATTISITRKGKKVRIQSENTVFNSLVI